MFDFTTRLNRINIMNILEKMSGYWTTALLLLTIASLCLTGCSQGELSVIEQPAAEESARAIIRQADLPSLENICFAAGTPIHTDKGAKSIETIKTGDKALTWNEETKKFEYKAVVETFTEQAREIVKVRIKGEKKAIEATPEHPFYVRTVKRVRANTTNENEGEWVEARNLAAGDLVRTATGAWEQVLSAEKVSRAEETVYNFEVEDNHNYFVGDQGFLVHNECRKPKK
jgi:hypothetical protein